MNTDTQEIQILKEEVKSLTKEIQTLREEVRDLKEKFSATQETLYLLSIPGMREKILEGGRTPLEECSEEIDW